MGRTEKDKAREGMAAVWAEVGEAEWGHTGLCNGSQGLKGKESSEEQLWLAGTSQPSHLISVEIASCSPISQASCYSGGTRSG